MKTSKFGYPFYLRIINILLHAVLWLQVAAPMMSRVTWALLRLLVFCYIGPCIAHQFCCYKPDDMGLQCHVHACLQYCSCC